MSDNNDASNESNSLSNSTRFGSHPIIRSGVLRPSVLGPSVLGSSVNNSLTLAEGGDKAEEKKNSELSNNPFLRKHDEDENGANNSPGTSKNDNSNPSESVNQNDEGHDERPDPLLLLRRNGMERASMFAAAKNSIPLVEKSGFVFGQNVHERVVGDNINTEKATRSGDNDVSGGGGSELLFSSVIQKAAAKAEDSDGAGHLGTNKETENKSLTDVAREYEESRAQKRKYEEVETFTGEENEVNICELNCKLFAFVNCNWEERGRGSLRLNDYSKHENDSSRVVFRTSGNLRLLVNTKVWGGMVAERPSPKSLRFTAMDQSGKIKIYLAMARPAEIDALHLALKLRIEKRNVSHPEECRRAAGSNSEEAKNGSADAEHRQAASAAAPAADGDDDEGEPCPKKNAASEETAAP